MVLSPITRQLTPLEKEQRAETLSKLHDLPTTELLQTYLDKLGKGLPCINWNVNTFIEGAKALAKICGADKVNYYDKPLEGLHYPTTFTELWNEANPQHPITSWDQDFRRQCPPGWEHWQEGASWVVRYKGEKPLSQGLNDFLRGPTTIDCGMFCQFILWMAIRYLVGDDFFDASFRFKRGEFVLTQAWIEPPDSGSLTGNPLYWFYDLPLPGDSSRYMEAITTRTFYNHATYLSKHPGGMGNLQNVTRIGGINFVFRPFAHSIISNTELEQMQLNIYNAPRDLADHDKIALYVIIPTYVHRDFEPKSFGDLANEAKEYENHKLSESDWRSGKDEREVKNAGLCLIFNFERLKFCLDKAFYEDAIPLSMAKSMKGEPAYNC